MNSPTPIHPLDKPLGPTNIQSSFTTTLTNPVLPDALSDIGENTIDSLINNPLISQLPIVKTVAGMIQAGMNIQDRLFLKKILTFLEGVDDIPEYERQKIIKEIDDSKGYQIQVGEKLLYILDNCYDHINAQNASKLFAAMIRRKISYSQFLGAAQVIARISPDELEQFLGSYEYRSIDSSAMNLIHTGLLFSEVSEIEVEVDLNKVEQGDWDDPPEHYEAETNTDGGELVLHPTASGDVIFEVFGIGKDALRKKWQEERRRQSEDIAKKYEGSK